MPPEANIYSVNRLTTEIKHLLELSYVDIWVEGEVSSLSNPASGHTYFSLKEENSILKCVLFKNKKYLAAALPVIGERILIRGRVSIYPARGDIQLICAYIEAAGEGVLRREFDELKNKLMQEGLYEAGNKQALPAYPKVIDLITSPQGAVLHDIISTLKRRYPLVHLRVYPVNVQGEKAEPEILDSIERISKGNADLMIIARGGGSLEDLQVFNKESIARALYHCPLPTVSAIGHETDFVITDFVADLRAPTPTAAATLVTPDIGSLNNEINKSKQFPHKIIQQKLNNAQQTLDTALQRLRHPKDRLTIQTGELQQYRLLIKNAHQMVLQINSHQLDKLTARLSEQAPFHRLKQQSLVLKELRTRLFNTASKSVRTRDAEYNKSCAQLHVLNPLNTLSRGYSILQDSKGNIIKNTDQFEIGNEISARLHRGTLIAEVKNKAKI